jgi:hypothetical protein
VLPLANAMSVLGDTLLVTDDTSYRYLTTKEGKIGGVQVLIKNSDELKTDAHIEYDDGVDYQNIIYDTVDKIDKNANKIIIVRNKDRSLIPPLVTEVSDDVYEGEPETPTKEVVLTAFYNKLEQRKLHYCDRGEDMTDKAVLIELKLVHYRWLQLIAETKEIVSDVVKPNGKDLETLMVS